MKDEITKYKFLVFPGNNPKVIQEALIKRKVWTSVPQDKILTSNFIWKPLNFSSSFLKDIEQILSVHKSKNVFLNHFQSNDLIGTKSGLMRSLKYYYSHDVYDRNIHVFDIIPTTFIVHTHRDEVQFKAFYQRFRDLDKKKFIKEKVPQKHCQHNIWFIKPESENQGRGIILTNNLKEIENFIFSKPVNSGWIIQKAIEKPLLYKNRKFDIRVWVLVSQTFDIYYYNEPYIRTSSTQYETTNFKIQIHLTNNAQQKKLDDYSKHQKGNTISFKDLQQYLKSQTEYAQNAAEIIQSIHERMKKIVLDVFFSVKKFFCKGNIKKQFEIFGFDFLLDQDFRVWLLQANANPYLGTPNDYIKDLLPKMIDQLLEIVVDPYFPPQNYEKVIQPKFQLIFKQVGISRISQIRSGSTQFSKKKNFYPLVLNQSPVRTKRNRRNSQAVTMGQTSQDLRSRFKIQTPIQSIKYLLQSYCFADLDPFVNPANLFLNSLKNVDQAQNSTVLKNLKLITDTRIASVLLERKVAENVRNLLGSENIDISLKILLINGLNLASKSPKQKQTTINLYLQRIKCIIYGIKQNKEEDNEIIKQLPESLVESLIKLFIKLGGNVDRKIFIPGESRENQNHRDFFIRSTMLQCLFDLHSNYSNLLESQVEQFMKTLNEKDWKLIQTCKKDKSLLISIGDQSMNESDTYSKYQSTKFGSFSSMYDSSTGDDRRDRKRKTSFRQANQFKNIQMFAKDNKKVSFPKIQKKLSMNQTNR